MDTLIAVAGTVIMVVGVVIYFINEKKKQIVISERLGAELCLTKELLFNATNSNDNLIFDKSQCKSVLTPTNAVSSTNQ